MCHLFSKGSQPLYQEINGLPVGGISIHHQLITSKWFCDHGSCSVKVFTERLRLMKPYARMTNHLEEAVRKLVILSIV